MLVEPGVRHALRNTSEHTAHLRTWVTPRGPARGLPDARAPGPRSEGLYNARNLPTGLRGAAWISEFALRFRDETVMCSPPPAAAARSLLPVAARLTRRWRGR